MNVLILGHSFVKSIHDHFAGPDNTINARNLCYRFNVEGLVSKIYLHGIRGATVTGNFNIPSSLIEDISPQIIILELGSNDLVEDRSIESIASSLVTLAEELSGRKGVISVIICGVLFRKELRGKSKQLKELNSVLNFRADQNKKLNFHEHKFLKKEALQKISRDGIHPNTSLGRKLYIKSISWALHNTFRRYNIGRVFYSSKVRQYILSLLR